MQPGNIDITTTINDTTLEGSGNQYYLWILIPNSWDLKGIYYNTNYALSIGNVGDAVDIEFHGSYSITNAYGKAISYKMYKNRTAGSYNNGDTIKLDL